MSELSMLALFETLESTHQQLLDQERLTVACYKLGKHQLRVSYSDGLQTLLGESMDHLVTDAMSNVALEVVAILTDQHFALPFKTKDYLLQGLLAGYNDQDHFSTFQHGANAFSFYDRKANRGYYVIQNLEALPYWEKGSPFRSIIHWWTEQTSYQLIHAAYLDYNGTGFLLSGKSGSGKSSTTIGAVLCGRKTLGDDYLLIDTEDECVYSLYQMAKLDNDALTRFPQLKDQLGIGELPPGEKALLPLNVVAPGAIQIEGKAAFHLLPKIARAPHTLLNSTSGAEALRTLAPSTMFQLPRLQELTFRRCGSICRKVPAFELVLGTSPEEIDSAIENFVNSYQ